MEVSISDACADNAIDDDDDRSEIVRRAVRLSVCRDDKYDSDNDDDFE